MPIYYFDISRNGFIERDGQGRHLLDLDYAREAASSEADTLAGTAPGTAVTIEIHDNQRQLLASVRGRIREDLGHPGTTTGSGKFQQPVLRGDNRMRIDPPTKLPTSPEVQPPNGGTPGTNAQTPDLSKA